SSGTSSLSENLMQYHRYRNKISPAHRSPGRQHVWSAGVKQSTSSFAALAYSDKNRNEESASDINHLAMQSVRGGHPVASTLIAIGVLVVAIWSATFLPKQVMS